MVSSIGVEPNESSRAANRAVEFSLSHRVFFFESSSFALVSEFYSSFPRALEFQEAEKLESTPSCNLFEREAYYSESVEDARSAAESNRLEEEHLLGNF